MFEVSIIMLFLFWVSLGGWWLSGIICTVVTNEKVKFVTYWKFKRLFEDVNWYLVSYGDNMKILMNEEECWYVVSKYKMYPSSSYYIYNETGLLPITPLTNIMIYFYVSKKIRELDNK